MNLKRIKKIDFKYYEDLTDPKILLDICDLYQYGVTDSNEFWLKIYRKPKENFKTFRDFKYGDIRFTDIFSYHKICHMFCVKWPKSEINIKPFKYNFFDVCCRKLKDYMNRNNIHMIFTPLFGREILEGNWDVIFKDYICKYFVDCNIYLFG